MCVITFRRPNGLGRLLDAFAALDIDPAAIAPTIVIVDNDVDESSRIGRRRGRAPVADHLRGRTGARDPFARNRAVREAAECDFVVFIDDDEVPDPAMAP